MTDDARRLDEAPQPDIDYFAHTDRALVGMGDAAYWLARTITGQSQPTQQTLERWRTLVRVWAHRYPDRVTRFGGGRRGERLYDLYELTTLAEEHQVKTPRMGNDKRTGGYLAQTGRPELTPRQARRVRRKTHRDDTSVTLPAPEGAAA